MEKSRSLGNRHVSRCCLACGCTASKNNDWRWYCLQVSRHRRSSSWCVTTDGIKKPNSITVNRMLWLPQYTAQLSSRCVRTAESYLLETPPSLAHTGVWRSKEGALGLTFTPCFPQGHRPITCSPVTWKTFLSLCRITLELVGKRLNFTRFSREARNLDYSMKSPLRFTDTSYALEPHGGDVAIHLLNPTFSSTHPIDLQASSATFVIQMKKVA